jgi:hypothetical protein
LRFRSVVKRIAETWSIDPFLRQETLRFNMGSPNAARKTRFSRCACAFGRNMNCASDLLGGWLPLGKARGGGPAG